MLISLRRKAVEQAIAAGRDEAFLRAVPRLVRRVPGVRLRGIGEAGAVHVADLDLAEVAARIVGAAQVLVPRKRSPVRHRPGHDVMRVQDIADARYFLAALG